MDTSFYYPRLLRRIQGLLIDSVVVFIYVIAIVLLLPFLPGVHEINAMLAAIGFVAIEPVLVSATGGTIGHHWMKLRVTRLSGSGKINIFAATLRYVLKMLFGWMSLVVVLTSRRHQALHDWLSRSVVMHKDTSGLPAREKLADRSLLVEHMPSVWRRVSFILLYLFGLFVLMLLCGSLVTVNFCRDMQCSWRALSLLDIIRNTWIVLSVVIVVLGWRGQLKGALRRLRSPTDAKKQSSISEADSS